MVTLSVILFILVNVGLGFAFVKILDVPMETDRGKGLQALTAFGILTGFLVNLLVFIAVLDG